MYGIDYTCFYDKTQQGGVPLSIENGTTIDFEVPTASGCTKYFYLIVEGTPDNGNPCALNASIDMDLWPVCDPKIKGIVRSWSNDKKVDQYRVRLFSTPNPANSPNDQIGDCDFSEASFCIDPADAPFVMKVEKDGAPNYLHGVSTFDLVKLAKHLQQVQIFTSPFQYVAGDVNGSGFVTGNDIQDLRKLILGVINLFPNNVPSWWYFKSDFSFPPSP